MLERGDPNDGENEKNKEIQKDGEAVARHSVSEEHKTNRCHEGERRETHDEMTTSGPGEAVSEPQSGQLRGRRTKRLEDA